MCQQVSWMQDLGTEEGASNPRGARTLRKCPAAGPSSPPLLKQTQQQLSPLLTNHKRRWKMAILSSNIFVGERQVEEKAKRQLVF